MSLCPPTAHVTTTRRKRNHECTIDDRHNERTGHYINVNDAAIIKFATESTKQTTGISVGATDCRSSARRRLDGAHQITPVLRPLAVARGRTCVAAGGVSRACRLRSAGNGGGGWAAHRRSLHGRAFGGRSATIAAFSEAVVMALSGESVGPRYIDWNFVSSSKDRIEQAREDWAAGRMKLPDLDNDEFISLPPPLARHVNPSRCPDLIRRGAERVRRLPLFSVSASSNRTSGCDATTHLGDDVGEPCCADTIDMPSANQTENQMTRLPSVLQYGVERLR